MGAIGSALGGDLKRPLRKVYGGGIGLQQASAPAQRLGLHPIHQIGPEDAIGEAGEVFHMGGGHQLAAGDATVLKAGDQQRREVGPGGIDGRGISGGP